MAAINVIYDKQKLHLQHTIGINKGRRKVRFHFKARRVGFDMILSSKYSMFHEIYHYSDITMSETASQIIGVSMVCSTVCSAQIKVNMKAPRHWPLQGNSPVTGEFPAQRASNAKTLSIWWRHHETRFCCALHCRGYIIILMDWWIHTCGQSCFYGSCITESVK